MQHTTLSSKGQVIIPKTLRVALQWGPGTQLEVHDTPEGILLRPSAPVTKVALSEGLAAMRHRLAYVGPTVTVEEMSTEVLRQAAAQMPPKTTRSRAASKNTQARTR